VIELSPLKKNINLKYSERFSSYRTVNIQSRAIKTKANNGPPLRDASRLMQSVSVDFVMC